MAFGDPRTGTLAGNANSIPDPAVCTGSVTVSVGDLVIAVCGQQTALTVIGATDNLGNTYTAQNAGTDAGVPTGRMFYSRVTVAGTLTAVNFDTTASANDWAGFAKAFEGPFAAPPIDANPANITSDATSPFTCPATGTLAQADEVVIAWGAANQSTAWAATSPMLLAGNANNVTNIKVAVAYKTVTATTSTSPEFTAAANPTQCILGTASFKKDNSLTGTASITLGSLTLAGTGTLDNITGSTSVTLGALTLSSTGELAITGTASATLGAVTVAAVGELAIAGSSAVTLDALTLAATGDLADAGLTGSLAVTLDDVTVSASGTSSATVIDIPRQPGGFLPRKPVIYLDDKGRPVDLKTYKARTANQAIQAAKNAVRELPKEDRPEAREALRALREAVAADVSERIAEQSRILASMLGELQGLLARLEEIAQQEALDEEAVIILLLVA